MKAFKTLAFLAVLALAACGTFEVGIQPQTNSFTTPVEISPTPSAVPPTETVPPPTPTNPVPTATQLPPDVTATQQSVQIFLIALEDNGQAGKLVGCGDSAVPVQVEIQPRQDVLRAALEKLLALKQQYYGQSGLYNALYQSDLRVDSVTIEAGRAVIHLSGTMMLGGECDNPRVEAQLEETALQFSTVSDVSIFINDRPLKDVLSLKGDGGSLPQMTYRRKSAIAGL